MSRLDDLADLRHLDDLEEVSDFRRLDDALDLGDAKAWDGEGGHLTPAENAAADSYLRGASRAEQSVTPDMQRIADRSGGSLEGLDFRLKSEESLKRKLATELALDSPGVDHALALRLRARSRGRAPVRVALSDPRAALGSRAARSQLGGRAAGRATSPPPLPVDRTRTGVRRRASSRSRRDAEAPADARARGRVIGGIFVLALVLLLVRDWCRALGSLRRLTREEHLEDRAACAARARRASACRANAAVGGRDECRARRCRRPRRSPALQPQLQPRGDHAPSQARHRLTRPWRRRDRAAILAAIAGSLGLALFGLLRYPGLRTGVTVWVSLAPSSRCSPPTCSQA